MHKIQEATTVEDMGKIYAALEDRQVEYQSNMMKCKVRSLINLLLF
jgi:hypothetical protein